MREKHILSEGNDKEEQSKTASEENFPVGSFLIPAKIRPHIIAYYNFARKADDIADSPDLTREEKLTMLDRMENVLLGKESAGEDTISAFCLAKSLEITGIEPSRATDLLIAFRQDSNGFVYDTFFELMDYCKYSACPVGRYMLDLLGEGKETYRSSDNLCSALQIINHIQDAKKDWQEMRRCYIPKTLLKEYGLDYTCLDKSQETFEFKQLKSKMIEMTKGLLKDSSAMPLLVFNRGLRMEICVIHNLAVRLISKLEKSDILSKHIELSKLDWLLGVIVGIGNGLCRRQIRY